MGTNINRLLTLTEIGMLAYWMLATAVVLNLIQIAPEYMYSDYQNPIIVSWNWSFLPIDILFAVSGLFARFGRLRQSHRNLLATVSLALMFCAGLMAISFWLIRLEFDPIWWSINLWLLVLSSCALIIKSSNS